MSLLMLACEPTLPDAPFACAGSELCPSGFTCQATVCVREGAIPAEARPMRVSWINAAEMYWFDAPSGGANLVVNDGFTPGGRGLYELRLHPDGRVEGPKLLVDFEEEFATASAVVELDAQHYGVLTLSFPRYTSTEQSVAFYSVERDRLDEPTETSPVRIDAPSSIDVEYLGGSEPAYVSAIARNGWIDFVFPDPSDGGAIVVSRIIDGAWQTRFSVDLPPGVLPLSADCLLWDGGDELLLRIGLEDTKVFRIPDDATAFSDVPQPPLALAGFPVFGFPGTLVTQTLSEDGDATYDLVDFADTPLGPRLSGKYQAALEPHTARAYGEGALLAPLSSSDGFGTLEVAYLSGSALRTIAYFDRAGTDELYSARAHARDGTVYLAWTSFHEALMDLWVATTPAEGLP